MISDDVVVVGAGLTGATIARKLANAGVSVTVVERRVYPGGNIRDDVHKPSGIRYHVYGPHLFRTSDDDVWGFVNQFADFQPYVHTVSSYVERRFEAWPLTKGVADRLVGQNWEPAFTGTPANFEEASLAMMPRRLYELFVRGYTEKQWGLPAVLLEDGLARRFDVRPDDDRRFSTKKHQGLPADGYNRFVAKLLYGIRFYGGIDYNEHRSKIVGRRLVVYTGPIDALYGHRLGRLPYRCQQRRHVYVTESRNVLPTPVVNYPSRKTRHVRIIEWRQMMAKNAKTRGSLLTLETPSEPTDQDQYEYPFPSTVARALYEEYAALAAQDAGLYVCGRLGEFRYLDMDQAIARALMHAKRVLEKLA